MTEKASRKVVGLRSKGIGKEKGKGKEVERRGRSESGEVSELKEMVKDLLKENRAIREDMRELKTWLRGKFRSTEKRIWEAREEFDWIAKKVDKEWVDKEEEETESSECETEEVEEVDEVIKVAEEGLEDAEEEREKVQEELGTGWGSGWEEEEEDEDMEGMYVKEKSKEEDEESGEENGEEEEEEEEE